MHRITFLFAGLALALAACSGDYGSGGSTGITPPVNPMGATSGVPGVAAGASMHPGQPTPTPSAPPGNSATYAFANAPGGLRCPEVNGYSCIIHLNVPETAPSPKAAKPAAIALATPVVSASPSPSSSSSSTSPAPLPSPTPAVSLQLEAAPHDVPAMVNPSAKSVATTALIALRLSTNMDVALDGAASADFILPQGQIGGRGFAVQLFRETIARHNRRNDTYVGSYSKSSLTGTTLRFEVTPPHVTVKRGEIWLFVLYANELPNPTASPSPAASSSPSTSPSPSPASSF